MRDGLIRAFLFGLAWCWVTAVVARDIALSPDGARLVTANHDARSLSIIDTATLQPFGDLSLGMSPDSVALDGSGRAWVTFRRDDEVAVYDLGTNAPVARFALKDEPHGVLTIPDGPVVISLFRSARIAFIDPNTLELDGGLSLPEHPRGLALSANGSKLYVTHFLSGAISVVDVATRQLDTTWQAEADGNLLQNLAVSADGTRLYLPQTRANVSNPFILFDTTVFPVVSVLDPVNGVPVPAERFSLDIVDEPVGIPMDAALTTTHLFVLNAASNDLIAINRTTREADAHLELGHHPRSMVLTGDGSALFVHNSLGSTVSVVDTATLTLNGEIPVAANTLSPGLLNGKRLFNSSDRTDLARDQWIACATCHFDGELDGRTWFFSDGPRNTPSLLGSGETGPFHWSGDLDELHDVESTIRGIQAGTGLADGADNCIPSCDAAPPNSGRSQDLDDLADFMASLQFTPNPNLRSDGNLSDQARRGRELFESESAGCLACHIPPTYADGLNHDVGTGGGAGERKGPDFNTPSLRGLFSSAPYLHDGRAATLEDVLTTHNTMDQHGETSQMLAGDLQDLVAFLESLTEVPPLFRSGFE